MKIKNLKAFTLAEVLIALTVIGVVTALTIPPLIKNYNAHTWVATSKMFKGRVEVALRMMNTEGKLSGYNSTESFLNEFKKYIKISKLCNNEKLTSCFSDKFVWSTVEEPVSLDDIKTAENLGVQESTTPWSVNTEVFGVQFSDGVNALLAYNPDCSVDPFNNQSNVMNCIAMIYDVNGFRKPNTSGMDLLASSNVNSVGSIESCLFELSDGSCVSKIVPASEYGSMSNTECRQAIADGKIDVDYCLSDQHGRDYFAAAVLACGGKKSNLPSPQELIYLGQYFYGNVSISSSGTTSISSSNTWDPVKIAPFLASSPYDDEVYLWSNLERDSIYMYYRLYKSNSTRYDWYCGKYDPDNIAMCIKRD